jgi:hypothetical protein
LKRKGFRDAAVRSIIPKCSEKNEKNEENGFAALTVMYIPSRTLYLLRDKESVILQKRILTVKFKRKETKQ